MRQLARAKPKTFLDPARRQWQFATYAWLLRACGGYRKFLDTELVLPVAEHFPDAGMKGHAAAAALFRRVRDHAGMADWPCMVEPLPASGEADAHRTTGERIRVIHYRAAERDPAMLVAHFGHELARFLVETIEEPPPGGAMLHEPAVDLAAVFMGFGVFMANSAAQRASWELNEGELVHALALFCHLRKVPEGAVEPHLNAHVRKYLRLALGDLAQFGDEFRKLRATLPGAPDTAECTLPTAQV